ncbi:hypothetical protein F3K44_01055 [Bacillus megaterium]|nr:hypothetical protein [Priestia megaterium]NGY89440.1 hypothetical protein [Priestia megaterium]
MPKDLVKELLDKGFKVVDLTCVGTINIISAKELYLEEMSTDAIVDMLSLDEKVLSFPLMKNFLTLRQVPNHWLGISIQKANCP